MIMQWTPAACALLAAAVLLLAAEFACACVDLHSFPVLLEPKDPPMACAAICVTSDGQRSCRMMPCLQRLRKCKVLSSAEGTPYFLPCCLCPSSTYVSQAPLSAVIDKICT